MMIYLYMQQVIYLFFPLILIFLFSFQGELAELRQQILSFLDHPADLPPIVHKLNFPQTIYVLSVFRLEALRY